VWYIINDLLNRELIKQNFRFSKPVVADDEEYEESKDEDPFEDINNKNQVIDKTQQTLREYFKQCDVHGIEEQLNINKNIETAFDEEENEMIMPSVDPSEWNKEINRIKLYIDKDLDSKGNVNRSVSKAAKPLVVTTAIDDILEQIESIIGYFGEVTSFLTGSGK